MKMRKEYSRIINEWDERVEVLKNHIENVKKQSENLKKQSDEMKTQLNKTMFERDSVKLDLEMKLNDKILEYKSKKL